MKIKCFDFTKVSRIALPQKLVYPFSILIHCWAALLIKWTYFKHMPLSRPELCKKTKSYWLLMKFGLQNTNSFENVSFNSLWCSVGIDHLMPPPWESPYAENKIQEHLLSKNISERLTPFLLQHELSHCLSVALSRSVFCCCCFDTSSC